MEGSGSSLPMLPHFQDSAYSWQQSQARHSGGGGVDMPLPMDQFARRALRRSRKAFTTRGRELAQAKWGRQAWGSGCSRQVREEP